MQIAGGSMSGAYVDLVFPWYETRILNCSFCGKMIAGEYWQDDSFPDDKFCEPSCAEVKRRLKGRHRGPKPRSRKSRRS
jgi:hypothetical protein